MPNVPSKLRACPGIMTGTPSAPDVPGWIVVLICGLGVMVLLGAAVTAFMVLSNDDENRVRIQDRIASVTFWPTAAWLVVCLTAWPHAPTGCSSGRVPTAGFHVFEDRGIAMSMFVLGSGLLMARYFVHRQKIRHRLGYAGGIVIVIGSPFWLSLSYWPYALLMLGSPGAAFIIYEATYTIMRKRSTG